MPGRPPAPCRWSGEPCGGGLERVTEAGHRWRRKGRSYKVLLGNFDRKATGFFPLTTAGFKRLAYALAALTALGGGILVAGNYLVSADNIRSQALNELRAVTGLNPVL